MSSPGAFARIATAAKTMHWRQFQQSLASFFLLVSAKLLNAPIEGVYQFAARQIADWLAVPVVNAVLSHAPVSLFSTINI